MEDIPAPGGNDDGVCDPGEVCVPADLGSDEDGNPLYFNSFDVDSRLAVIHYQIGAVGYLGDSFTVSFGATPNAASTSPVFSNKAGIWTARVDVDAAAGMPVERFTTPAAIVQVDDMLENRHITSLSVHDALGKGATPGIHSVAFLAATDSGQIVARITVKTPPVIFIHGVIGSRLVDGPPNGDEVWLGSLLSIFTDGFRRRLSLFPEDNPSQNIRAVDVLRTPPVNTNTILFSIFLNDHWRLSRVSSPG